MYAGRLVELGPASTEIFSRPAHPYTARLIASTPSIHDPAPRLGIVGTAPPPEARPRGCFFTPRCPLAQPACSEAFPPVERVESTHTVRCFRWRASIALSVPSPRASSWPVGAGSVLEVTELSAGYGRGTDEKTVLHSVSLAIRDAECVGIVGESGSGKSTFARCVAGLHRYRDGAVKLQRPSGRA